MSQPSVNASLEDARVLVDATRTLTDQAVAATAKLTANGKDIDAHQVVVDRVAYAATEARAAAELLRAAQEARSSGKPDALLENLAIAATADLFRSSRDRLEPIADDIDLHGALEWAAARDLDRRAPETIPVPSGRTARLTYQADGTVVAAVKLQELFGLAESPRLGPRQEPVIFEMLAPNGRPVQTTRDLRSFWNTTYQEVRKELRGRYPRHPWPEDPWTAPATARAKPRK